MSLLPGLGLAPPSSQPVSTPVARLITLLPGSEWRFEVAWDSTLAVKLLPSSNPSPTDTDSLHGTAELFGTELAPNHNYDFSPGTKAAIFTHHGCTLSVTVTSGPSPLCESEYTADETPMAEYANLHFALENMRNSAARSRGGGAAGGPRVLVVGPENAGKSSLVKTLAAYAVRGGRTPLVVNLDPNEGVWALPGSVSAAVVGTGQVADLEEAAGGWWGSGPIAGPSAVPVKMPVVYHVGFRGLEEGVGVFKPVCTRAALVMTSRFEHEEEVKVAGMLVDVGGSVCRGGEGYEVLSHIVSEFSINVLLVLGSERLYSDMTRRFPCSPSSSDTDAIHVLKLSKSGGCVDRDASYMRTLRDQQIRSYFFGTKKTTLSPHTQVVDFDSLAVFRMVDRDDSRAGGRAKGVGLDFLPGGGMDGEEGEDVNVKMGQGGGVFERVRPGLAMQNAILAVKHAEATDGHEAIRDASVMGYLYVADVDEVKRRVRVLSPMAGRLPSQALVWGVWPEGGGGFLVG